MTFTSLASKAVLGVAALTLTAWVGAQEVNLARNEKATEQAIASLILADIYKKAGYTAKIQPLPGARANAVTLAGEKDGEVGRVQGYATKNPSLIKVEPSYYFLTTTAFAKGDKNITIASKDDLKKYKVGVVRGIAHAEAAAEGVAGLQVVGDYDQMYQMLEAGRIDVALDAGVNGPYVIKKLGLKDIKAVGDIAKLDLFTMMHESKKDIAAKVGATIKSMKDSGDLAKLVKRHEEEFIKSGVAP